MSIHFITFANTDSNFSTERISFEARKMNIFDSIKVYNEKDFDDNFIRSNGKYIQEYKRGYGYWSWKPYIIKKEFEKINDGDVIVYADCGCMFVYQNILELKKWIDIAHNSESGILSPSAGPYLEHEWTRMDLYDYVNKTYNKNEDNIFENTLQICAAILVINKNAKSVNFINDWYDVMTTHFKLCTDDKSSIPNHPKFKENRHDQSVFSLLAKIYKIELIKSENGVFNKNISPIITARCKNDKYTWVKPIEILFYSKNKDKINAANELNKNEIIDNYTGVGLARGNYQKFICEFATEKNLLKKLKNEKFDIFYTTQFSHYNLKYLNNKPLIISIQEIPKKPNKLKELFEYAKLIEINNESIKKILLDDLKIDENKIYFCSNNNFLTDFQKMIDSAISKKDDNISDKLDLYICSHKDFIPPLKNNIYKIIDSRKINNDSWNGMKGSFYSEIMSYFYIAENIPLKDYVGFLSWRKYWKFYDNLPNIPKLIDDYEIIVAKPIIFDGSIKKQYEQNHNIEDLYIVSGILAELYPSYIPTWNVYLNQNKLYPYNMFIMKKDEFLKYTYFIKSILYKYVEIVGTDIEKRVENNKNLYLKDFGENNSVSYQSRIGGYLAERLTNLWIHANHKKVFTIEVDVYTKK